MRETSSSRIMSTVHHQTVGQHVENDSVSKGSRCWAPDASGEALAGKRFLPRNRMSESFTYGSVGGPGYNPKPRAVRQLLYGGSPGSTRNRPSSRPMSNPRTCSATLSLRGCSMTTSPATTSNNFNKSSETPAPYPYRRLAEGRKTKPYLKENSVSSSNASAPFDSTIRLSKP